MAGESPAECSSRVGEAKHRARWPQGRRFVESAKPVEGDRRRFAAPAHRVSSTSPEGGPALEAPLVPPDFETGDGREQVFTCATSPRVGLHLYGKFCRNWSSRTEWLLLETPPLSGQRVSASRICLVKTGRRDAG